MPTKGELTKTTLLEIARELFAEKGYAAVTMKDFTDRSGLSRGGLYRHFTSTKEICVAMLNQDRENSSEELEGAIAAQVPATQLLRFFLNRQSQELQNGGGRLSLAIYEFCLAERDQRDYMTNRYLAAVAILVRLIRYGQERQEFVADEAETLAQHIILFLEGLKLSSGTIPFSPAMLEKQFQWIEHRVVKNNP